MEILTGNTVCSGLAMAEAVLLDAEDYRIPYREVAPERLEDELALFEDARSASIDELQHIKEQVGEAQGHDVADVFSWHIGVLNDTPIRGAIEELIRNRHYSAAYATSTVMRGQQRRFAHMPDPVLAERIRDLHDIERRLLRHILGHAAEDLDHLTQPVVLVAHDLTPSQTAHLHETAVAAVVLEAGGATSHTAILLRALGRPAIVGVQDVATRIGGGETVIVDAVSNLVIARPDESTLAQYRDQQRTYSRLTLELDELLDLEPVTRDGERIFLMGNIEFPAEASACVAKGADGVGLYRTEYLFLRGDGEPSEEEQYLAYREAIEAVGDRWITIRSFDLGADKATQEAQYEPERNPMLGLRSIRFSLQNLDMFKRQLRAVLRASAVGRVRLMFPLIVSLMEFRQARMTLHDAMEDLEEEGLAFGHDLQVGMMMETPAAALQCKDFVREVDFISIGTNDLVQYMLAVDRSNERVARFYNPLHPSILRVLRDMIRTCKRAGVDCSLCGEIAGQAVYTLLLLGLGLRTFSMAPGSIPEIKKLIRLTTLTNAQRIARRAMSFETARQIGNYLRDETRRILPYDPI